MIDNDELREAVIGDLCALRDDLKQWVTEEAGQNRAINARLLKDVLALLHDFTGGAAGGKTGAAEGQSVVTDIRKAFNERKQKRG